MELRQASSVTDLDGGTPLHRVMPFHGGTEVVPLLRAGILEADVLVDIRKVVPRGIDGTPSDARCSLRSISEEPANNATATRCAITRQPNLGTAVLMRPATRPVAGPVTRPVTTPSKVQLTSRIRDRSNRYRQCL